jgi:hypothetical protein
MNLRVILSATFLALTLASARAQAPAEARGLSLGETAQQARLAVAKVEIARSDLDMAEERAAWAGRMVAKGYMSPNQMNAEKAKAAEARIAYDQARRALDAFTGGTGSKK